MRPNIFKIQITGAIQDEEHVRLSDFVDQLKAIKETLNELDKKFSKTSAPTVDYKIIDLSHASPSAMELEAIPLDQTRDNSIPVINKFFEGIEKINMGYAPDDFDSDMLEHFSKIGRGFRRNINSIVFLRQESVVQVDRTFEAQIRKIVGEDEILDGSVEGALEMINFHGGVNKFNIYPMVGSIRVTCHFHHSLLREAINAVGKYVNVSGKLKYKKRDRFPYGVDVETIEIYPEESQLPSIFDLKGISPEATGNLSSEEFIRRLRNAR